MARLPGAVGAIAVAIILIGTACGNDSTRTVAVTFNTPSSTAARPPATETTEASAAVTTVATGNPSATTGATPTTVAATPPRGGDPSVTFTALGTFEQPVDAAWSPSDDTTYVVEQSGLVVIMKDGQPGPVALDMTSRTSAGGEQGLLGMAVSPDGALAYVDYTDTDGNTQIDEYAIQADGSFDANSRRQVLSIDQPYPNHNGGGLVFGPDHLLYIGTGDGGGSNDPQRRSLNLGDLLGKILRIDPHRAAAASYSVPADNPFVAVPGARPEIWSVGLRNPWRFSFDRQTGDLWIADVGQNAWEEVDAAWAADGSGRGMNFGWSAWEGNHRVNEDQPPDGATPPIYEYPHGDLGCAISGGVRYRGAAIPALVGWYVYGDYCGGHVHALKIEGNAVAGELDLGAVPSISAVTEAPDGELLVLSVAGPVFAVTPG